MTAAGRTGLGLGARLGAAAVAELTVDPGREPDLDLLAGDRLLQRQRQVVAQIDPALRAPPAGASAAAEDVAEDIAEDVGEGTGVARRAAAETAEARPGPLDAGMTELIIGRTLLGIGQHVIGQLGLFELGLGLAVARIAVGVIFHRQPPEGLLDVGLTGVALNPSTS
jgi:hypothetical protein